MQFQIIIYILSVVLLVLIPVKVSVKPASLKRKKCETETYVSLLFDG